ncbi:MAG: hypothetical protein DI598_18135 [Pseudopedobacter saltans]|uniref:Uncharacterized protein n=1 Tax=Pseudopedobacter saltans TaxID=151895 RepID=A0A2W5EJU2_9SPHI|nr:MAG: hypothetical protein DI598_18135 [Pseudopedobacter saltans]
MITSILYSSAIKLHLRRKVLQTYYWVYFKNIKVSKENLPDFVLASLYPNSLVIIGGEMPNLAKSGDKGSDLPIPNKENVGIDTSFLDKKFWLGDNTRNILLLVNDSSNVYTSDINLGFLGKILAACQFNLSDVAVVNLAKTPIKIEQLQEKLSPKYVIFFNCKQSQIGLKDDLKPYQPDRKNGCTYLLASSLTKMNDGSDEAKQEKQRFWISLKQVFGIV